MNWLAHVFLSPPDTAFRLGNVLPDMLPLASLQALPIHFQSGIACHRAIDAFTDSHPVVRRSVARISPAFRRFGGVLTDVFYDHFLSKHWNSYSTASLDQFIAQFYDSFELYRDQIPPAAFEGLEAMKRENWLGSYREIDGIELTLKRISHRLKRPFALDEAITELKTNYEEFEIDFREFFPELQHFVAVRS